MHISTMELHLPFNLISFFLFLSFLTLLVIKQCTKKSETSRKFPPGPPKLPLIGNLHQFVGPSPQAALRDLAKKYGKDLMHLQLGDISTLVVSSADMAKEFLRTHDHAFADRPPFMAADIFFYNTTNIILCPYGDYWRQIRKVCLTELLSVKMVRSFSSIRYNETRRLLDRVRSSSGKPINIHDEIAWFTGSIVCRAAFGKIFSGIKDFLAVLDELSTLVGWFCMEDMFPSWKIFHFLSGEKKRMMEVHLKADAVVEDIMNEHKKSIESGIKGSGESGTEDMIDVLLMLKDNEGKHLDDNIKAIISVPDNLSRKL